MIEHRPGDPEMPEPYEAEHPRANGLWLLRRVVAVLCLATVVLAVLLGVSFHLAAERGTENCARIHHLYMALDTIIASNRARIQSYVLDGTLTAEQGARALHDLRVQRRTLAEADCPHL